MMRFEFSAFARLLLVLWALIALAGRAESQSPTVPDRERAQLIAPGDVLRVTVWRHPELSGDFTVSVEGTLKDPVYQAAVVAGVPLSVARERIGGIVRSFQEGAPFIVEPLFRVAVGGAVSSPGLYHLPRESTLYDAVATAGGAGERSRLDRVRLIRGGEEREVNLSDLSSPDAREPIVSGDQLIVRERGPSRWRYVQPALTAVSTAILISYRLRRD